MNDAGSENPCAIDDWMIDLLEDDRPTEPGSDARVSNGLHWMYHASFIRSN